MVLAATSAPRFGDFEQANIFAVQGTFQSLQTSFASQLSHNANSLFV